MAYRKTYRKRRVRRKPRRKTTRRPYTKRRMGGYRRYGRRNLMNTSGNHYQLTRYVPYTAYSSTGTGANSSVGSIAGDMYIASLGYALAATPADTDGYTYSSFRFTFTAADIFNYAEYFNLFEEFKIAAVTLRIRYVGNGACPNTLARGVSATSAQYMPTNPSCYLIYRKMHRDMLIPTASGAGWLNFRDSSGVREYRFPGRQEIRVRIQPRTMQSVQTSGLSNEDNLIVRKSPWLTTGNSTYTTGAAIPHYGIDLMLRAENFITNDATNVEVIPHIFNVTAQYHLKFRYRRAGTTQL